MKKEPKEKKEKKVKEPKKVKVKVPGLFKKRYTEKQYRKKILGKLYIPSDKALIESLFTSAPDPKKGDLRFAFPKDLVTDKATAKRIAKIAKEIKKQKGRVNVMSVVAALLCVAVLVLTLVVFRNQIARVAVVSAMQGSFGAKCDIKDIDVNLLDTHFTLDGLALANRKKPMTNLFEVGHLELYFNLLELSRGKFVAETVEITGVTWNTARTVDGTLPPKAEKKYQKQQKQKAANAKPNPVQEKLDAELAKIKSGVSVDSGIAAIKDQLDPKKYIEREKAALLTPAIVTEIQSAVPALTSKWEAKVADARKQADVVLADTKAVSLIKPETINTLPEIEAALAVVNKAGTSVKSAVAYTEGTVSEITADTQTVKALAGRAETAIGADAARLKALADSIKSINFESGSRIVTGLFDTFLINTLGSYYPLLNKGIATIGDLQSGSSKPKAESLKKKSSAVARLSGRNFAFGDNSMPRFVMKNVALSAGDAAVGISGAAGVKDITNDQDKLGKPLTFDASVSHGAMGETVSGVVDFRKDASERVRAKFDVGGYHIAIDGGNTVGVPSLSGTLGSLGTLALLPDGTLNIETDMKITGTKTTVPPFEPEFIYTMYTGVLAEIKDIDLDVQASIAPDRDISLSVKSEIDDTVNAALKKQIAQKVEEVKAEIRKYAETWLAEQKKTYADEIARFNDISGKAKKVAADVKNGEKIVNDKKAELEARSKAIVDEYTGKAKAELEKQAAAAKAVADEAAAKAAAEAAAAKAEAEAAKAKAEAEAEAAAKAAAKDATSGALKKFGK